MPILPWRIQHFIRIAFNFISIFPFLKHDSPLFFRSLLFFCFASWDPFFIEFRIRFYFFFFMCTLCSDAHMHRHTHTFNTACTVNIKMFTAPVTWQSSHWRQFFSFQCRTRYRKGAHLDSFRILPPTKYPGKFQTNPELSEPPGIIQTPLISLN